nr:MAG TPA: hypothetical protein [Bacteriophage sp.]
MTLDFRVAISLHFADMAWDFSNIILSICSLNSEICFLKSPSSSW